MATTLGIFNIAQFVRVAPTPIQPPAVSTRVKTVSPEIAALSLARYKLLRLRDAIGEAKELAGSSRVGGGPGVTGVSSTGPLVLDNATRAAVLESVEEINTTPTSFTPFGPDWTGSGLSTALITIGGIYDGSGGAGTLRFESRDTGVHGLDRLRIRVRNTNNSTLANVSVNANDPLDQQYALPNGLHFTLGPGTLIKKDELTVDVSDVIGSAVNPSKPFDGVRNENPNLEPGQSVAGGTLVINGVGIPVGVSDSVDTMLAAINGSGAGVTASFDAARERLVLTQNTPGLAPTIMIDTDDSGFAAATKLAGAVVTPGRDADIDSPLINVTQFQSVQSGVIRVNETDIVIDIQTDSLRDILDRINASQSEATATYSEPPQQVTISSNQLVTLDDGTTGFLAALNIPVGAFGSGSGNGLSGGRRNGIVDTMLRVTRRLDGLLSVAAASGTLSPLGAQLEDGVGAALRDQANAVGGSFGLSLSAAANAATLDTQALARNLQRNARSTLHFLVGTESSLGFLDTLSASVEQALANLDGRLSNTGSIVSLRA